MFCKKPIIIENIMKMMPRLWIVDEFYPHLAKIRLESEKNMLILSQDKASKYIEIRNLRKQLTKLPKISKIKKNNEIKIAFIRKQRYALKQKIASLSRKDANTPLIKTIKIIGFCPRANCKGFIGEGGICGICKLRACINCGEICEDDHVCNDDIKKSFRMMTRESKRCPRCSVLIYQISGCDQMWCVLCHTPFSWRTGERIDGVIHNRYVSSY
jgi:hypothetical protein